VLFTSGGDIDGWARALNRSAGVRARELALIGSVRALRGEDGVDPHWWQDPTNAARAAEAIRAALAEADPEGAPTYAANARALSDRMSRLDRSIAGCMSRVPAAKRKLVTTHDALGYYARRYDVEVIGALIPSLSTQAQPSGRDIQRLVDQIRSERVEAIFPESALDPRLERAVSREAGVRVGRELWADSLGPRGSGAETLAGALSANTAAMVEGMSGGAVRCRPSA
jgi:ABC-type Zn uptake system ZnuABC Zn-binding protein ZnuA